jgi:flagellar M-ring protein FliF
MKVIGPEVAARKGAAALQGPAAMAAVAEGAAALPVRDSAAARMIELAKVNGEVQQQSLEKIGELVKGNPVETVSVLRSWIHERS